LKKDKVLAVVGPTASGKTSVAIALAQKFDGEIVCCDSMQIYKHMKIGTASPTDNELSQAPHHLFNFLEPTQNYNAALYQEKTRPVIEDILSRNKVPILCGGTGLYVKAALYDMNFTTASSDEKYRIELEDIYKKKGAVYLHDILKQKDSESANNIHPNNVKRVIRALEILHLSGVKKSSQKQDEQLYYKNSIIMGINHVRDELYKRINMRVDMMIAQGLEREVRNLLDMGVSKKNNALQAIGYKEWLEYFDGDVTLEECIYQIKLNSRHYAKRQITWFNKMSVLWYDYNQIYLHNYTNIFDNLTK
jgi:tRNA dimethylallyltransferase